MITLKMAEKDEKCRRFKYIYDTRMCTLYLLFDGRFAFSKKRATLDRLWRVRCVIKSIRTAASLRGLTTPTSHVCNKVLRCSVLRVGV